MIFRGKPLEQKRIPSSVMEFQKRDNYKKGGNPSITETFQQLKPLSDPA